MVDLGRVQDVRRRSCSVGGWDHGMLVQGLKSKTHASCKIIKNHDSRIAVNLHVTQEVV